MRRAGIVFLALMILVSLSFVSIHTLFLGVSDDVTVTRQTLYGDPAAADGVNILVRNQYAQKLLWETALTLDSASVPETDFTFKNDYIRIPSETEFTGIEFNTVHDVFRYIHTNISKNTPEKYKDLVDALTAAVDAVPEGERKTFTFDFAKYLEYYPLEGQVILPELTTIFSEFEYWTENSKEIADKINAYFRIPITGEFKAEFDIDKTGAGSSYGASINMDHYFDASGVATGEACYFAFNALMEDGTMLDTSLIPGGYGIYCLPYDENGLQFDEMKMVLALDTAEAYEGMKLSADSKRIRLYTRQGEDLMLTVIDIATMSQVQKVKMLSYSDEWYYDVIDYDDFTLISEDRRNSDSMDQISVWEENSDGTWSHAFTAEMNLEVFPEGSNLKLFSKYSNAVDYRDGKLSVITHRTIYQEPYWYRNYCDIYVAVYDATGMTYAGTCEWNLTQVNNMYPNDTRIQPSVVAPLEVFW